MLSAPDHRCTPAFIVCADAAALAVLRHAPTRAVAAVNGLGSSSRTVDTDTTAAALCSAGLFLVAAWLGVGLVAAAITALPGATGRCAERASRVLLPSLVRRMLAGTAGLGVILAPVAATATALTPPSVAHVASTSVSAMPTPTWPTTPPTTPVRSATRAAAQPPATRRPSATPARTSSNARVDVATGDSLWLIAAHRLGENAADGEIARYWPRVYARNRSVIGDDPALIEPGQQLTLPDPTVEELPS